MTFPRCGVATTRTSRHDRQRSGNGKKPERFPDAIVVARDEADVVAAVRLANAEGWTIGIRSGGHAWSATGVRDGGLLLDLSSLDRCGDRPGPRRGRCRGRRARRCSRPARGRRRPIRRGVPTPGGHHACRCRRSGPGRARRSPTRAPRRRCGRRVRGGGRRRPRRSRAAARRAAGPPRRASRRGERSSRRWCGMRSAAPVADARGEPAVQAVVIRWCSTCAGDLALSSVARGDGGGRAPARGRGRRVRRCAAGAPGSRTPRRRRSGPRSSG